MQRELGPALQPTFISPLCDPWEATAPGPQRASEALVLQPVQAQQPRRIAASRHIRYQ